MLNVFRRVWLSFLHLSFALLVLIQPATVESRSESQVVPGSRDYESAADPPSGSGNHSLDKRPVWPLTGDGSAGTLEFDGVDDTVNLGRIGLSEGQAFSIAMWCRPNTLDIEDARLISKATAFPPEEHQWTVGISKGGAIQFRLKTDGMTTTLSTAGDVLAVGEWAHVLATYDGSAMRIHKDGIEVAILEKVGRIDLAPSLDVVLGGQPGGGLHYEGLIKDVRIYDRVLSVAEIASLSATSAAPAIDVWYGQEQYFGHNGVPQTWVNLLGRVSQVSQVDSVVYSLSGGPESRINLGPDGLRLTRLGDFNIEIAHDDLSNGPNQVAITVIHNGGNRTTENVTIQYAAGVSWDMPSTIDFESAAKISDVADVVDGRWELVPDGVRVEPGEYGYDRLLVVGQRNWPTEYEVLMPITIHGSELGGRGGIGVAFGWQGHTGPLQPRLGHPYQSISFIRDVTRNQPILALYDVLRNGSRDTMIVKVNKNIQLDVTYLMRVRSEAINDSMSRFSSKLWEEGASEPSGWDLEYDFVTMPGSLLLICHRAEATFGNVAITPLPSFTPQHTVTVNTVGGGSVSKSPDKSMYGLGETVTLTAVPDPGWAFAGWSDGLSGTDNPETIVVQGDTSVTASFIIEDMSVENVAITSTSGNLETSDDLTSQYTLTGAAVTAASAWYRDGVPVSALCMPMEGNEPAALADYSGHGGTASKVGTPVWSSNGGHDGFGCWLLDGDDGLMVPDASVFDVDVVSLAAWIYVTNYVNDARIISKETGTTEPYSVYTMNLGGPGEDHLELRIGLEGQPRQRLASTSTIPLNTWTHVAATFDGNQVVLYINGLPEPAIAVTPGVLRKNDEPVYIGMSQFWSPRELEGRIDDARVYGYALSPEQVAALAATGGDVVASTETSAGEEWSVRVTPFSAASVGTAVTSASVTIGGPPPPTYTVTVSSVGNGSVTRNPDKPSYTQGETVTVTATPDPGAVFANWSGDLSGSDNPETFTVQGDMTITAHFTDEVVTYAVITNTVGSGTVTKNPNQASYTLGETVTVTAVADPGWSFSNWSGGLSGSDNPETIVVQGDTTVTAHFTAEGVSVGNVAITSTSGNFETTDDLTAEYGLAGSAVTAASAWYRDGAPVSALCMPMEGNEPAALADYSGHGGVASKVGSPVWMASGGYDGFGAWAFDGDDGIVVPDGSALDVDVVSLAAWIYVTSYVDDARIITKETGTSQPYSVYTMSMGGPGEDHVELRLGLEGQSRQRLVSTSTVPLNTWTHVAVTFDGNEVIFYINGIPDPAIAVTPGVLRKNNEPVYVGMSQFWPHPFFEGRIDDARVYGHALSPEQVAALVAGGGDVIASPETADGEEWMVSVTPFSSSAAGASVSSATATIGGPLASVSTMSDGNRDQNKDPSRLIPGLVTLQQNFPNPFAQTTQFSLGLPQSSDVQVDVFDVAGRRVYMERIGQVPVGWSQLRFEGADNHGRPLAAGVYFYRLSTNAGTATRKVVIAR